MADSALSAGNRPAELFRILDERLDQALSAERAAHSRRTAELAADICSAFGLDPDLGRAAGLAHDMCKELPLEEQRALAALYPDDPGPSAIMADKALHGPAAAALLSRDYGVDDEGLLEAVAFHTLGRRGMGKLAAALYCADKLEPGRKGVDELFRRRCVALPPELMVAEVARHTIDWFRSRGKAVAPETLALYNSPNDGDLAR